MIEIRRVTDMQEALNIAPIEVLLKEKGKIRTTAKDFLTVIQAGIDKPLFGLWIAYDTDKVVGYTCATISPIKLFDMDYMSVIRFWTGKLGVANQLLDVLSEWGREHKMTKMRMTTRNHLKAIVRKYKFSPISVVIERRL